MTTGDFVVPYMFQGPANDESIIKEEGCYTYLVIMNLLLYTWNETNTENSIYNYIHKIDLYQYAHENKLKEKSLVYHQISLLMEPNLYFTRCSNW
jgi:hypothetical protein